LPLLGDALGAAGELAIGDDGGAIDSDGADDAAGTDGGVVAPPPPWVQAATANRAREAIAIGTRRRTVLCFMSGDTLRDHERFSARNRDDLRRDERRRIRVDRCRRRTTARALRERGRRPTGAFRRRDPTAGGTRNLAGRRPEVRS
jgi:hypothetical protein